jgi:DNA primase
MLLAACEAAAAHWEAQLAGASGAGARAYLAQRGISPETVRAFRVGFAPDAWHDLHRHLASMGFRDDVQHAAGLLAAKDGDGTKGRPFDRFRNRVMLPIRDSGGRVIGFGGRALDGDHRGAKYLNGPETPLFRKSRALFGVERAASELRRGRALLVEGFFDAIAIHQAGFTWTVATCGTTVGTEQVDALKKLGCAAVVLLFDGDAAGAAAPARNARALLASGVSAFVARLPDGSGDPDDFLRRRGKPALEHVLASAVPLTEHLIDEAVRAFAGGADADAAVEHKLRVVRELAPHVAAAPEGLPRNAFEKAIARRLQLDLRPLRAELQAAVRAAPRRAS